LVLPPRALTLFFLFTAPATTEIYPLSLHDALPILGAPGSDLAGPDRGAVFVVHGPPTPGPLSPAALALYGSSDGEHFGQSVAGPDRKSTRLNSSHVKISYAVFCLKKKNKHDRRQHE